MRAGCPILDEPRSNQMQGLDVSLCQLSNRHKAHGGLRHGFTDRFSIARLVLRRLHVGFDTWGPDQPLELRQEKVRPPPPSFLCSDGMRTGSQENSRYG
jgi:hypothetical protein